MFLHFDFLDEDIKNFKDENSRVLIGFDHENYMHFSELSVNSKKELSNDFAI